MTDDPRLPQLGPLVPRRGNRVSRAFGRLVFFAMGWRIEGSLPNLPKCVLLVAPHTSTADIIVGLAGKVALGVRVHWLGKHTVHKPPLSWLLTYVGGIPVDRTAPRGVVDQVVDRIRTEDALYLGIAPEGTRRRVETWKTGFHRIARAAEVPIVPVALDYPARTIRIGLPFAPTDDMAGDIARLRMHFRSAMAYRPEQYVE